MVLAYRAPAGEAVALTPVDELWVGAQVQATEFLGDPSTAELQILRVVGPRSEATDRLFNEAYALFGIVPPSAEERSWTPLRAARRSWTDEEPAVIGVLSNVVTPRNRPKQARLIDTITITGDGPDYPFGNMVRTLRANRVSVPELNQKRGGALLRLVLPGRNLGIRLRQLAGQILFRKLDQ